MYQAILNKAKTGNLFCEYKMYFQLWKKTHTRTHLNFKTSVKSVTKSGKKQTRKIVCIYEASAPQIFNKTKAFRVIFCREKKEVGIGLERLMDLCFTVVFCFEDDTTTVVGRTCH